MSPRPRPPARVSRLALLLAQVWALLVWGTLSACSPQAGYPARETLPPGSSPAPIASAPVPTEPAPTAPAVVHFPEYRLALVLYPGERRLVGRQQVTVPNHTGLPLDEIVFRLYPNLPQYGGRMTVGPVSVDGQGASPTLRGEDTVLAVPLPQPLAPEASVLVDLSFEIEIPETEEGYTLFGYSHGSSHGIWSVPDGYALLAVHDGQGWHEDIAPAHGDAVFAGAALYDVTLTLPAELTLAPTGVPVGETPGADGARVYHLAGGPLREFTWLASADYRVSETTAYGTLLRSYYLPGDQEAGEATLNIAAAALRAYEDAFGPYPFERMIVAEAPLLHYGMEYPGLNLIGLDLYREQQTQLEDRVIHEIAHQWWYAQVGNDQVNTPWLDEGLAEYSLAIYYPQVLGLAQANTLVNQRWLVPYQVAVENGYDAVVNQPSSAFSWEYEVIVYAKAALFFHALHQELGDDGFRTVLQAYLERYRWEIATPEGFLETAESVSGQNLDAIYSTWILTSQ
ncbi:MAG: M1 family metallopeptidase [Anaerolineae bacterium]